MPMPVVQIRRVGMFVHERLVPVHVGMGFLHRGIVLVTMVLVVDVDVLVLDRSMLVHVAVLFGSQERDARAHEHGGCELA